MKPSDPMPIQLQCDMFSECTKAVAMVDNSGFLYCESHGLRRDRPCRKLRPFELNRLMRGETIKY